MQLASLAGASSVFAGFCTHGVDTCKIRMQIQKPLPDGSLKYKNLFHGIMVIVKEEGLSRRGLYKGIEASALREASYSTLRLGMYEPIKRMMGATDPKNTPIWKKYVSGALAGLTGSGLANPADLIKTRMQGQPPGENRPLGWHIRDVYKTQGGLRGFYVGVNATMMRACLLGATYMGTYDSVKHAILNRELLPDGFKCQLISSICSGLAITLVTSPVDNIKTRIMN